jgi:hypothetical protein
MSQPTYNRRDAIKLAGKAAVLVGFVGVSAELLTSCVAAPWTQIANLGNLYIAKVPAEGSQAVLAPLLGNPAPGYTPTSLFTGLKAQISTERASGQTMMITGLQRTVTEWRICAFWATRPPPTTTTTGATTTSIG